MRRWFGVLVRVEARSVVFRVKPQSKKRVTLERQAITDWLNAEGMRTLRGGEWLREKSRNSRP